MIFRLKKPLYYRPTGAYGENFRYELSQELLEWMFHHRVAYDLWWENFERDGQTYLGCYIDIKDSNHALLFKLSWYE